MTTETKTPKRGDWIATITGICAIHGIEETWGTFGDTPDEARRKLNIHALEAEGHELTDWEGPIIGRVFELPHRQELAAAYTPVDEATPARDPVEDAATAVYAQIEDLTSHDRLLVLRMAISAEERNDLDHTDEEIAAQKRNTSYTSSTAVNAAARANIDMDLRRVTDQLRNLAAAMAKDMTTLLEDLEVGRRVNELGIVQGSGSAIDRLCGQRQTLIEIRRTLEGRL